MANNGIILPEIILHRTLEFFFSFLKEDLANNTNPQDTLIYDIFKEDINGLPKNIKTFDLYEEARKIILSKKTKVFLGYNMEVSGTGCVHIMLPSESGKPLTIGGDEGYMEYDKKTDDMLNEDVAPTFTQTMEANYQLMVTSENTLEVIIIYNLMKACFISLFEHLELSGLRDIKISGQDLSMQNDLVPTHIFHRSLMISFFYENDVSSHFYNRIRKNFITTGIIQKNT